MAPVLSHLVPARTEKPIDWFGEGVDVREIVVDDGIKQLCDSIVLHGLLQHVGAIDRGAFGEPFFGFRRLAAIRWGKEQGLKVPALIPVAIYPDGLTPTQAQVIQLTENLSGSTSRTPMCSAASCNWWP